MKVATLIADAAPVPLSSTEQQHVKEALEAPRTAMDAIGTIQAPDLTVVSELAERKRRPCLSALDDGHTFTRSTSVEPSKKSSVNSISFGKILNVVLEPRPDHVPGPVPGPASSIIR